MNLINQIIQRLKNNIACLSLLPILIGQFGDCSCFGIELGSAIERAPSNLHISNEIWNLVEKPHLNEWAVWPLTIFGDIAYNLGSPLTNRSQETALTNGAISAARKEKRDDSTSRSTAQKTTNECSDWVQFMIACIGGFIGGALGSLITLALRPNVES
jgi:hypothetical protein